MEKRNKIWITILSVIGVLCLVAACVLFLRQAYRNHQSKIRLEALRESAAEVENASSPNVDGTEDNALSPAFSHDAESSEEAASSLSADGSKDNGSSHDVESSNAPDNNFAEEAYTEEAYTKDATESFDTASASESAGENAEKDHPSQAEPNPYADVFTAYEDIVAWLVIPDTIIDYPVVWTPEDENYYLYRDIDGNKDKNGCLILDTDSSVDPLSTNLIIHGHNMRSGAMFGNLTDYEDLNFYKEHKQIILYTKECRRSYEIISVFRSQVYKKKDTVFKYYKFFQANTQEEFEDFYQNIKNLSQYDTGVTAEFGDRFLTLSTCVYHVEQGRFVVVAKEVESSDPYLPVQE